MVWQLRVRLSSEKPAYCRVLYKGLFTKDFTYRFACVNREPSSAHDSTGHAVDGTSTAAGQKRHIYAIVGVSALWRNATVRRLT